jgi:hypothetical protein
MDKTNPPVSYDVLTDEQKAKVRLTLERLAGLRKSLYLAAAPLIGIPGLENEVARIENLNGLISGVSTYLETCLQLGRVAS